MERYTLKNGDIEFGFVINNIPIQLGYLDKEWFVFVNGECWYKTPYNEKNKSIIGNMIDAVEECGRFCCTSCRNELNEVIKILKGIV